eukprot:m.364415 g.364415  ORF g.364415 m.364415 type:complete len:379 (-) comp26957_c0_seq1:177-1313(-)
MRNFIVIALMGVLVLVCARLDFAVAADGTMRKPQPKTPCGASCRKRADQKVTTSDDMPEEWLNVPDTWGPSTLHSNIELDALGTYVAPIFYGGLGNLLFQVAALTTYCDALDVPCVFGYFQHWNREYNTFMPWGDHTPPAKGVTLKSTFPNMRWIDVEPNVDSMRIFNRYAFKIEDPDEFAPLPRRDMLPAFIHGYFFNAKYWHSNRQSVLDTLTFNPAIVEYNTYKYGDILFGSKQTVSLHLRMGYSHEPAAALLKDRKFPPASFYDTILSTSIPLKVSTVLVFSDDNDKARTFMENLKTKHKDLDYTIIDENVVMSLELMTRCHHHILTSSTLSFWGAYLDRQQPDGGKTFLHSSFFNDHGRGMVPQDYGWVVLEE